MTPVPVNREGERDEALDHYDGDLAGFLATAQEIGSKVVLVMQHRLIEEQFLYAFDDDPTQKQDDAPEEVDLAEFSPSLAKYRRYLDEVYYFFLIAKGGAAELCFAVDQPWVEAFENEIERAEGLALLARRKNR